jgi:beta-lactamase superfamily II metal-dependent hydrolase
VFVTACDKPASERPLEVFFIDVGHGSSILIRTPDDRTCLIDGGAAFAGANRVAPLLDSLRITELDYTFVTNYTPGRIGGLDEVLRHLGGEEGVLHRCYDRGWTMPTPEFCEYASIARSRRQRIKPGELIELGDLSIWCIASNGRVVGRKPVPVTDERDRSLALLVSWGEFDMLVLGDLASRSGSGRLALADDVARQTDGIDLLAVPDNGAEESVTYYLQQELGPAASVISVGADTGLLSQHTVNTLARRGRRVYTTGRVPGIVIPVLSGRAVDGDVRVTVSHGSFTVAGDVFPIGN